MNKAGRTAVVDCIREAAAAMYTDNQAVALSHVRSAKGYAEKAINELNDTDIDSI